jgi:superfamily II DNA/RNA helicase
MRSFLRRHARKLAGQIAERFSAYGRRLSLRTAVIFGGVNQHSR